MSKIVVVGANHAGLCINKCWIILETKMKSLFLTKTSNISFLDVEWLFGLVNKLMDLKACSILIKKKLEAKGAKVYMNSPVLSIDYDNKVVTAEVEGKEHKRIIWKLIFATGSTPILPPIEGVEIVKGNREFKGLSENVQFVKLYQKNAESH